MAQDERKKFNAYTCNIVETYTASFVWNGYLDEQIDKDKCYDRKGTTLCNFQMCLCVCVSACVCGNKDEGESKGAV